MTTETYNVLVVDDEPGVRRTVCIGLEKLSGGRYRTIQASNGYEGLDQMRKGEVDIVLTDIRMPEMDGERMIKTAMLEGICPPHVLVMSGNDLNQESWLREGNIPAMRKPFSLRDPVQRLDQMVQ
jgi:CheY-like chemotaxis protein